MYICVCKGITQSEVEECLENASVLGPDDVEKACGAGSDCGACRVKLERLFESRAELPFIGQQNRTKAVG